jgi:hypothetical protein
MRFEYVTTMRHASEQYALVIPDPAAQLQARQEAAQRQRIAAQRLIRVRYSRLLLEFATVTDQIRYVLFQERAWSHTLLHPLVF